MAQVTTIGRELLDDAIPSDLKDKTREFNKKTVGNFFQELAEKHPEEYVEVLQKLTNISRQAATEYGVDAFSTPQVMAFALELYEAGILTDQDLPGMPSDNEARFTWLLDRIVRREEGRTRRPVRSARGPPVERDGPPAGDPRGLRARFPSARTRV